MVEDVGRRPATVAEAREMLGTKKMAWPPKPAAAARPRWPERSKDSASSTSPGCCRAGSARCCSPTWAPRCSRSRTPAAATTSAGCRPTTAARRSSATGVASAYFLALNRNKRSLRLNLKDERGRDVLLRLVEDYDVLVESFRPGVMDRLGVGYEALRERNPRLIYCPISGYGQDGPLTARSGHDTNYLALNGLLGLTGRRGGPADPVGRPDRRPRRRRADGGGRDPGRGDRARALRRGPDGRHLDDRRRAVVARDGRRALLRRADRSRTAASPS